MNEYHHRAQLENLVKSFTAVRSTTVAGQLHDLAICPCDTVQVIPVVVRELLQQFTRNFGSVTAGRRIT